MELNEVDFMEIQKQNIEEYGLSLVGVCSGFTYTIGMSMIGLPDLIISTKDPKMAKWVLNHSFVHMRDNWGFKSGIDNNIATVPMIFKLIEIDKNLADNYVCQTLSFYRKNPFYVGVNGVRFAQILWPDKKGLYPYDEGYNHIEFPQELFKALNTH